MWKLKFYPGRTFCYSLSAILLTAVILTFPSDCLTFALKGLNLWFERMIPTLFPFMVLSGIIIRMNLADAFVKILKPVLSPLFRVRGTCLYGVIVGFLCGFPMGAHVAAQLYGQKQISRKEAAFLLSFCNNIGPVYFLSFVLPVLSLKASFYLVFGMYGLPLLYGLFLRYTVFAGRMDERSDTEKKDFYPFRHALRLNKELHALQRAAVSPENAPSFLQSLDESIFQALCSIAKLGGYMIFFNLLFILPHLIAGFLSLDMETSGLFTGGIGILLEITGGIGTLGDKAPYLVLCLLPFGGISCIAQTYSMIRDTDLSIREYVMHKLILTAATVLYYLLLAKLSFLPS